MSFDVILPFLRPIAHLIQDPEVSEIMVNGSRRVFVERDGRCQRGSVVHSRQNSARVTPTRAWLRSSSRACSSAASAFVRVG